MVVAVYLVSYSDQTIEATVTNEASIIEYWWNINVIDSINIDPQPQKIIGLNCKWGLNNINPKSHKISIMQFCVGTKCLLLQLNHINTFVITRILKRFFMTGSNNIFVGIGVEDVVSNLQHEYGILCCDDEDEMLMKRVIIDVRSLAKERYPFSFGGRSEWIGLKTLAYQLVKLPRSKQRKNNNVVYSTLDFESLKLEKEIVKSACIDVYVSYRICHKLIKEI
ncbi:hypothetical protein CsatB_005871 [Cannabis sativa]